SPLGEKGPEGRMRGDPFALRARPMRSFSALAPGGDPPPARAPAPHALAPGRAAGRPVAAPGWPLRRPASPRDRPGPGPRLPSPPARRASAARGRRPLPPGVTARGPPVPAGGGAARHPRVPWPAGPPRVDAARPSTRNPWEGHGRPGWPLPARRPGLRGVGTELGIDQLRPRPAVLERGIHPVAEQFVEPLRGWGQGLEVV